MFKKKLFYLGSSMSLAISIPFATSISTLTPKNEERIIFDNRIFKNKKEIMKYLIQKKLVKINDLKVYGDIAKSYSNFEKGELNKALLPDYEPLKSHFAYFNAGGGITQDYESAKNSYFNPGRIRTMYSDGFERVFLSEGQAKASMERYKSPLNLNFYNVDYVVNSEGETKKVLLNPFNTQDINKYKRNIKDNITSIIKNNLNNKDIKNGNYKIKLKNSSDKEESGFKLNIKAIAKNVIKDKVDDDIWVHWNGDKLKITDRDSKTMRKNMSTDWIHLGNNERNWRDTKKVEFYNRSKKQLSYWLKDNGPVSKKAKWEWTGSLKDALDDGIEVGFTPKEFTNFLNGGMGLGLNEIKEVSDIDQNNIKIRVDSIFDNIRKVIKNDKNISDMLAKIGKKEIFKNDWFKQFMFNKVGEQIKTMVNNATKPSSIKSKILLTGLPNFSSDMMFEARGIFGIENHVKLNNTNAKFSYKVEKSINFGKEANKETGIEIGNKALFNKLLNLNRSNKLSFVISKNEQPLFDVTISLKDNKIKVDEIKVSSENQINQKEKNKNILKEGNYNLYKLLSNLKKDLDGPDKTKTIFDKYFNDTSGVYTSKGIIPKSNFDFNADKKIDTTYQPEIALKTYLYSIKKNYDLYKDSELLLANLKTHIIKPEDILIYRYMNNKGWPSYEPTFAKYIMKSISYFNANLTDGLISENDFATNAATWQNIKNRKNNDLPAQILVAYDANGKVVNVGKYKYDSETLMEFNVKLKQEPRRNYNYIYVDNYLQPVENINRVIHKLEINNHILYFDTSMNLQNYILEYIANNSYKIN